MIPVEDNRGVCSRFRARCERAARAPAVSISLCGFEKKQTERFLFHSVCFRRYFYCRLYLLKGGELDETLSGALRITPELSTKNSRVPVAVIGLEDAGCAIIL